MPALVRAVLDCVPRRLLCCLSMFAALAVATGAARARAEEAQWIWSPAFEKGQAPIGTCYFRKTFELGAPEQGEIQIACDDDYELFVNGRQLGTGKKWKVIDVYDVSENLVQGTNCIAVKAHNTTAGSAGLVARVLIKVQGNTHVTYSTDATWKTALGEFSQWQQAEFNDSKWLAARAFGPLGSTLPWGSEIVMPGGNERFKVNPEFRVEWVIEAKQTGSLISMAFDEFGQIIASRENGSLIIVRDANKDGLLDSVETYCDQVKNCQGILSISGRTFVTGDGPQGTALYRLSDEDHDGRIDRVEPIVKFTGEMGEHGPHSLVLGPDGLIYIVVGNFSRVDQEPEASSPYHHFYEGDLVTPRYEDAAGHAVGVKAPGGTILRTDTDGSAVELFAGGLQNPYDIAFTREGELFTADSDWEWDLGMPWYRPTRINHVIPGAEFGWRSGWAKWPDYYLDSLPATVDTGRGSPTGIEVYNHFMYPLRYHNSLFVCDWSRGRILSVKLKPYGGSYKATPEVFLEGQPLNVTDIAVGPDGFLYFCTGGRETEGGIYRIVWTGKVPPEVRNLGQGVTAAIRQPQLNSAWARQRAALIKQQAGPKWEPELTTLVQNSAAPVDDRVRALDLLQLFGPYPPTSLLVKLADDPQPALRAKAAYLMGIHSDRSTQTKLAELVTDKEPLVQRLACESIVRSGDTTSIGKLFPLLASPDQFVSWSARRALEKAPAAQWETAVLEAGDTRTFVNGAMALLVLDPEEKTIDAILDRSSQLMKGYLNDQDFLDLLRVLELALMRGKVPGDEIPELRQQLADEYPSRDPRMNRELVRMLVHLQDTTATKRLVQQLQGDAPMVEKMHVALHARFLQGTLTLPQKLELLKFYEEARALPGGHSYVGYIENISRDFFAGFNDKERERVLIEGAKWPTSALSVLAKLPDHPGPEMLSEIQNLDRKVKKVDTDAARRLRIGIAAVLGASGDPTAMAYLRELFENEPDRRVTIAMALAQQPDGDNWPLLVRALSVVEGSAAQEVLVKLAQVDQTPDQPEAFRQAILRGLMLRDNGGRNAVTLLEKWTGQKLGKPEEPPSATLAAWQKWFVKTYPNEPEPKLPVETGRNNWTFQELLSYLTTLQGSHGSATRGSAIFEKAQCAKCHRFFDRGDTVGPDLSTVRQRFQKKEILESILFPSQVISDQYASQTVVTKSGRKLFGMVAPAGDGSLVVLEPNGRKVTVQSDDIEETQRSKKSAMPDGLLNNLTLEEIADLFAYLTNPPHLEAASRGGKILK